MHGITALPSDLPSALQALAQDTTVRGALGDLAAQAVDRGARADWSAWHRIVTPWETEQYAETV